MKKRMKNAIVLLFPVILLIGITVFSLLPPENLPAARGWFSRIPHNDKIVHFCFYFSLVAALRFAKCFTSRDTRTFRWQVVLLTALYGGVIELLQGRYFGRGCDIWDEAANIAGAITAGWLIPQLWYEWLARKLGRK